jgi:SAM-dependent methyltransferase
MTTFSPEARDAYDALAPSYDDLTDAYDHETWLEAIDALARSHGLRGKRLLDVGCGTGKSFAPMLARGFDVRACDVSPDMVEIARTRAADPGNVFVADMRDLPQAGEFDLITCIDDAVNYLADASELLAALEGMHRNLAPGGLLVFDINTRETYRTAFRSDWVHATDDRMIIWRGQADECFGDGDRAVAVVDVFTRATEDDSWERRTGRHEQRHFPAAVVADLLSDAGFEVLEILGQHRGVRIEPTLDEGAHAKALFVARRA